MSCVRALRACKAVFLSGLALVTGGVALQIGFASGPSDSGALAGARAAFVDPGDARVIQWRSGTRHTTAEPVQPELAAAAAHRVVECLNDDETRHVVLQFAGPLADEQRDELAQTGVTLLAYLNDHAYFAALDPAALDAERLGAMAALVYAARPEPAWKTHPLLLNGGAPDHALVGFDAATGPQLAAYVQFYADVNLADGANLLAAHGATIRDAVSVVNALVVELPLAAVPAVAGADGVQWIEPALPRFDEWNDSNRTRSGAATAQLAPYNLTGAGVTVLVYDGGYARATHQDFGGRLTVRDASGLSGHSTHVAGTIGGSGAASSGVRKGMAPGVTIQSYGFQYDGTGIFLYTNPGDLQSDYNQAINTYGADIANNSIGTNTETNGFPCSIQGDYGVTDQLIDNIVRGSLGSPFRVVWANGNERQGSRCDVEGFGDYYSTAPPATAKNHIAVGALNSNNDSMTSFSSWGPTDDGRMKPDIAGPGCQSDGDFSVTSTYSGSDTQYASLCGTSMAAPTVTGALALLLQDFRAQYPAAPDPRNSTMKILLAHTAVDLGNVGPDYVYGYGSVRIVPAIDFMRTGQFEENSVGQAGVVSYTLNVPAGTAQLKITLAWDDAAGTPNVVPSLINDLDLRVVSPSAGQAFPWTLNPANPSAAAARTARNTRDNIEQVVVDNPAAGAWTMEVHGFNVPNGPQPYSVCASVPLSGGPCNPPATPTGVSATDGSSCTSVTVSWSASAGAASYGVYRNTVNDAGSATLIGSSAASPLVDSSAGAGTTYYYFVDASNGCGTSARSTGDAGSVNASGVPAAPTGVSATDAVSCAATTVSWNASAGATSYQIWRSTTNNSATATQVATDSASPYDDTTGTAGTVYYYWLRATGTCGTSGFSSSDAGSRAVGSTPSAPTRVKASDGQCNVTTVTWKASNGATSYEIYRGTSNNSAAAVLIGTSTTTSFGDTTGAFNQAYNYWVKARSACGVSGFSSRNAGSRVSCP
ncbi:MAG: S8 family serine peptidase [Phycisphaerae bacterium]